MNEDKRTLNIDEHEYTIQLMGKGFQGPLNIIYGVGLRYNIDGNKNAKGISISVTDRVINQWTASVGRKISEDELTDFVWQVLPALINPSDSERKQIVFHCNDSIQKQEGVIYFQAAMTMEATAREVIFASSMPTNTQIRREIIKVCYAKWQESPHSYVTKGRLQKAIPVTDVEIERNLKYLKEGGFIEANLSSIGYVAVIITKHGIDVYENPTTFNSLFSLQIEQQTINVGGDILATTINGSNNTTIVKSQVSDAFNAVKKEIRKMDIENNEEAVQLVSQLETEIQKSTPEQNKVRDLWDKIKKIPGDINSKLLSHPIIAQIIATQLLSLANPHPVN
ncbi:MAG: hypothetical protein M1484_04065 [Patescibacteria group bacterium]|nr:hypothetical protein [Patescibacteria group bacterium]MCL5432234.1 hypothetical protein [Patescibacteria group bacterium]